MGDASFTLNGGTSVTGRDAIEKLAHDTLKVHEDGTPGTRHVTTNVIIDVDEETGTADSRSYFTVFQALPGSPLHAMASGRYGDRSRGAARGGTLQSAASSPICSAMSAARPPRRNSH